jgi:hypothetical protein
MEAFLAAPIHLSSEATAVLVLPVADDHYLQHSLQSGGVAWRNVFSTRFGLFQFMARHETCGVVELHRVLVLPKACVCFVPVHQVSLSILLAKEAWQAVADVLNHCNSWFSSTFIGL